MTWNHNKAPWALIRHSPPGMPYGFVRIFIFNFLIFLFFHHQGFRMITFDRQAGPLQNFNRSHVMVIGRSVSFSDPARPPGGGVGRPKHPKPPPQFFFGVLRPHEHFLANFFFQLNNSTHPPPPPHPHLHAPPSHQNTHPNPRAIINSPNNCTMTYRL